MNLEEAKELINEYLEGSLAIDMQVLGAEHPYKDRKSVV